MLVKDIVSCIEQFRTMFKQGNSFTAKYSNPWHFNKSYRKEQVPFANSSGIYIYSKPAPNWEVPINHNDKKIWYIGKSDGGIAARVWQHMGVIYEPGTKNECNPRFKYHQWAEDIVNVPADIRQSIAEGNVVVYTVRIEPGNNSKTFNPQVVEKYLLACFYRAWDELPVLNKDI